MTKITPEQVRELAKLARVGLEEKEIESLSKEMTSILSYVGELEKVDTAKVKPTSQVTGLSNVLAEDKISKSDISREKLIKNAPEKEEGFIKVKKVLE